MGEHKVRPYAATTRLHGHAPARDLAARAERLWDDHAAALLAVSPELEESARLSGASWLRTMLYVVVPLLKPGIAAAWLLLFIIFVRELGVSILLYAEGTEVRSVVLYSMSHEPVTIAAFAVVQTVILLAATVAFQRISGTAEIAA
ncbi:MAG: ABC transporter permease subunit [Chloroflexi bacterium]|nr:ABC transporter permease subunit [Chloroflexota bacterium]